MNNPISWALPIYRAFGIQVRVHLLFFIVTLGLFLRQISEPGQVVGWGDIFLFSVVLLFITILLHEYGHCFGGRGVGGEAEEILIWPLGGLAFVQVPKEWRAHTFTAFAGPLVNIVICFVAAVALAGAGFVPTFNPLSNPYVSEMHNYRDGRTYTSEYGLRVYFPGTTEEAPNDDLRPKLARQNDLNEAVVKSGLDRALAPSGVVWLNRLFWMNWFLLLLNLLPVFPLDGGQMLQGLLWSRLGYRDGTTLAVRIGFGTAIIILIASVATNESLLMGLGLFMLFSCWMKLRELETEDSLYSSEFASSFADDEPAPVRPKRVGFVKRWLRARAARKLQREAAQRENDDQRMDQLLDKIAQFGKQSLTAEEQKFMERVSERYRNR